MLDPAQTARVLAILPTLEALVADPGRELPDFPVAVTPLDAAHGMFVYDASEPLRVDRNKQTTIQDLLNRIGPTGLQLPLLSSASVTWADATWRSSGSTAVAGAAQILLVDVVGGLETRCSVVVGAAAWRALPVATPGAAVGGAGLPLIDRTLHGRPLRLWLGRTAANLPVTAYERGRAALAPAVVNVRIS